MDVNDDNPIEIGGKIYKVPKSQRPSYKKYEQIKSYCKKKNIEFQFTYEDWLSWWAQYPNVKYGRGMDEFVMIRIDKNLPFCKENVQLVNGFTKFSIGGLRHPRARPVSTPSGIFKSVNQAARAYGISDMTVYSRVKKKVPGWSMVENDPTVGENS